MISSYTQKFSTIQKVACSKASSLLDSSSQGESLQRKASLTNNAAQREEAPRPNNTGMPDNLKSGIESLSGFSMDNVRVHYNSSKPATVQALAYTQGTDIHVAPGQEKCLPHEAWHVAQQMAGRVSPTTNINGMPVNDNAALEHEADVMGEKAVQCKNEKYGNSLLCKKEFGGLAPVQMDPEEKATEKMVPEEKFKQDPETFMKENVVLCDYSLGLQKRMGWDKFTAADFCACMNEGLFIEHYFVLIPFEVGEQTAYILTPAVEKYDLKSIENASDQKARLKNIVKDRARLGEILSLKSKCYIEACYVPYKRGSAADAENGVGHANVKKKANTLGDQIWNPDFVFTDVMNGCAFATTESEDKNWFSVWHFQSPGSNIENSSLFRREKDVTDWFGVEEYGEPLISFNKNFNVYPEATNFLWRNTKGDSNETWKILSQNNSVYYDLSGSIMNLNRFASFSRDLNLESTSPQSKLDVAKKIYSGKLMNFWAKITADYQSFFSDGKNVDVIRFYKETGDRVNLLMNSVEEDSISLLTQIIEFVKTDLNFRYNELPEAEQKNCMRIKDGLLEILDDKNFLNPLNEDYVSSVYLQNNCLPEAIVGRHFEEKDFQNVRNLRGDLECLNLGMVGAFLADDIRVVQIIADRFNIQENIVIINENGTQTHLFMNNGGALQENYANGVVILNNSIVIRNMGNFHFVRLSEEDLAELMSERYNE